MSIHAFLTKDRGAPERWIIGFLGAGLLVFAALQVSRSMFAVAAFLAGCGAVGLLAAMLCSDKTLRAVGYAAILCNIAGAVFAMFGEG